MDQVAPGLFLAEDRITFFGASIPTRMFVVELADGRLWVCSPLALTDALREWVGDRAVAALVSPNKIHNARLAAWAAAFPEARVFAAPGLRERVPALAVHEELGDAPPELWAAELDQTLTQGNSFFAEALFFHRASGALLATDLVENMRGGMAAVGGAAGWAMRVVFAPRRGPRSGCFASPEHRLYTDDVGGVRRLRERLAQWDVRRVLLCHGSLLMPSSDEPLGRVALDEVFDLWEEEAEARWGVTRRVMGWAGKWQ